MGMGYLDLRIHPDKVSGPVADSRTDFGILDLFVNLAFGFLTT